MRKGIVTVIGMMILSGCCGAPEKKLLWPECTGEVFRTVEERKKKAEDLALDGSDYYFAGHLHRALHAYRCSLKLNNEQKEIHYRFACIYNTLYGDRPDFDKRIVYEHLYEAVTWPDMHARLLADTCFHNLKRDETYKIISGHFQTVRYVKDDIADEPEFVDTPYTLEYDNGMVYHGVTSSNGHILVPMYDGTEACTISLDNGRVVEGFTFNLAPHDTLKGIQGRLKNFNYYKGPVHGILDEATKEALRKFQRRHGLPVTGKPDPATVEELKIQSHGPLKEEEKN